ncbi:MULTISPECIES: amidohydrolase family protein [unclassified Microbulbifer]|uniref:amidohydrolase family protein n=1 Tax=unclassified Microbulbifer TaxID=2619833 RepID=UPI0027E5251A|nr:MULTISPECIES: amidohydrolase family protein [unclassified Microbulbifer]
MKSIWIVCAVVLLAAGCDRREPSPTTEKPEAPADLATQPEPAPEPEPLQLSGVERLLDLRGGRSPGDYIEAVKKFIRDNSDLQVIVGKGWDAAAFGEAPPHKAQLDQVNDLIPIVLFSRDHRTIWANSEALAAAGINVDTPNPEGGVIEKADNGLPTGLLRGSAVQLIEKIIPKPASEAAP